MRRLITRLIAIRDGRSIRASLRRGIADVEAGRVRRMEWVTAIPRDCRCGCHCRDS